MLRSLTVAARLLVLTLGLVVLAPSPSAAQLPDFTVALTKGHVDTFALGYGSDWSLAIDNKAVNPIATYSPDTTILVARPEALTTRPAGSLWDFIGVPSGASLWLLPQNAAPDRLFLGTNAESVPSGTLAPYVESDLRVPGLLAAWVTTGIVAVRGPGAFSVWSTNSFGQPTVWISTTQGGLTSSDKLIFLEGGHSHWNWGFTARGVYEVDVVASARLNDGFQTPVASEVKTYYFGVEHSRAGDANLDGCVTGADFTLWADSFGRFAGDAKFTDGDFNRDGFVTGADYTLWADHFDSDCIPQSTQGVPEPATWLTVVVGIGWGVLQRRIQARSASE